MGRQRLVMACVCLSTVCRAEKLRFDARAWGASLATGGTTRDPNDLVTVLAAARPVFTGGTALLAHGVVDDTAARIAFTGARAAGRTMADAGDVVATGYTLLKVDAGPPFVLEIGAR